MKSTFSKLAICLTLIAVGSSLRAANSAGSFLKKPETWFGSDEAKQVAENILSWQSPAGTWPKNTNTTSAKFAGKPEELRGTFDNNATTDELRFLARICRATTNETRFKAAFFRGFDHILKTQYPNGGWPQSFPPGNGYARYITFNDNSMVRIMEFVREVAESPLYDFVDQTRRARARESFHRGVECILKCQIKQQGKLTAWCAQHDEVDFSPRSARTFELASFSGAESVGIVRLLMSLDRPSPEILQAIEGAVAWFEAVRLTGIKVVQEPDRKATKGFDKRVVKDEKADPLWARFYDLESNKPIFVDRDGIPKSSLAEIGYERRNGYAWLGDWPAVLLDKEFPAWKKRGK